MISARRLLGLTLAVVCLVAAAGCRKIPGPPWARAFAVDGATPRTLLAYEQTNVPLRITNTGSTTWNPARVHLSYHWLWLVPRELATRRPVPYHDGIRTDLVAPVAPGASVAMDTRLLAPWWPGLYWLQWDIVEEGVTWFSQVSPPQARVLVVVYPSPDPFIAALPLVVALALVVAHRRRARRMWAPPRLGVVDYGDVVWCMTALAVKPAVLVREALLEPTVVAWWLVLVAAIGTSLLVARIGHRRTRVWVAFGIGVFGSVLILGDVLYFRFFGDVLSASAVLGAHQTGRVWGSIRSLLSPGLLWLLADVPVAFALAARLGASGERAEPDRLVEWAVTGAALTALLVVGLVVEGPQRLRAASLDQMFRARAVMEQLGPYGYHLYDGWNYAHTRWLRQPASQAERNAARDWFAARAPMRAGVGQAFGAARGRNLIVIQVESLQDFAVDHRESGEDVMPNLRRWTDDAVRFQTVTDQTSEGRTSDAEFASLTSLLPIDHGAVAFRYSANHYVALPSVLAEHGYSTLSAVPFEPGFWNRGVMHPSYGFQKSLFEVDFQLTEQIGWGLNDVDFLQQMVPRLEQLPRPFCAWMITLSLHHPFEEFPEGRKQMRLGALDHTSFGNYLHTMRLFDTALAQFKAALARDGLLDNSVIVVFGDHDAGFPRTPELARQIGVGPDEGRWALNDRVPLFIRVPGDAVPPGTRDVLAGQTDFAPTLLALLGIDPSPLPYMGRNLFGQPGNPPVLRPYGDWRDQAHLFISHGGAGSVGQCVDVATGAAVAAEACASAQEQARMARDVSRLVVSDDLQSTMRRELAPR